MTQTYAPSRKVHAEIGRRLKPGLAGEGWRKQTGGVCSFARPSGTPGGQWLLWVQVSQWGDSDLGNEFTLNLDHQHNPAIRPGSGPASRILSRLDAVDRQIALAIETRIVARKPIPGAERQIHEHMRQDTTGQLQAAWERAFTPQPARWHFSRDPWLTYYSLEDVAEWAGFLFERLPRLLQRSENDV